MDHILYNKEILTIQQNSVPVINRAFLYGDGIFESIIVKENRILYLKDHFERLEKGMNAFSIIKPEYLTLEFLIENIRKLAIKNNAGSSFRIRLSLWRKTGGLYAPFSNEGELMITMDRISVPPPSGGKVFFYNKLKKSFSIISEFKTMNAAHYVLASIEKTKLNAQDMILLDTNNFISECTASNIFFVKKNKLYTPSLDCACISGVVRKQIIKIAGNNNIEIETGAYICENILEADFVFSCNVASITPIRQIEEIRYFETCSLFDELIASVNEDQMATAAFI